MRLFAVITAMNLPTVGLLPPGTRGASSTVASDPVIATIRPAASGAGARMSRAESVSMINR